MTTKQLKVPEFVVEQFSLSGVCRYTTKNRGSSFVITNEGANGEVEDEWTVMVQNASSRAYNTLGSYKVFKTLNDVEKAYKSLQGIVNLSASLCTSAVIRRAAGK